jgi:hypothetical protein
MGRRAGVLQFEIEGTERFLEWVVGAMRRRPRAGVVHLREPLVPRVLHHGFQIGAGRLELSARLVARADDQLLPAATARIRDRQEFRAETLPPLDVELGVLPKLHGQVLGEIREIRTG